MQQEAGVASAEPDESYEIQGLKLCVMDLGGRGFSGLPSSTRRLRKSKTELDSSTVLA